MTKKADAPRAAVFLLLGGYAAGSLLYLAFQRGFSAYSYDDVIRALQALRWARGSGTLMDPVWLPLPRLIQGLLLRAGADVVIMPPLLNLALATSTLWGLDALTRRLLPSQSWPGAAAVLLMLSNAQLIALGVSGAAEPLLWCLCIWALKHWLEFAIDGKVHDGVLCALLAGLASWTRPEAWGLAAALTAWAAYAGRARYAAAFCLGPALFFGVHLSAFSAGWNQTPLLQHYGPAAMAVYPRALARMYGVIGVAGLLASLALIRRSALLRPYSLVAGAFFALLVGSAWTPGIPVLPLRAVVLPALLFAPLAAAGWTAVIGRTTLFVKPRARLALGLALGLALLLPVWINAVLRGADVLSPRDGYSPQVRGIAELPAPPDAPNILLELHTGDRQERIHGSSLLELFAGDRGVFVDRERRYAVAERGDVHRLILENNPSILDERVRVLERYLSGRRIGMIVLESPERARRLRRALRWDQTTFASYSVLRRR